jgi:peroxiredoxin
VSLVRISKRLLVVLFCVSCAARNDSASAKDGSSSARDALKFDFAGVDGSPIASSELRGRVSVLLFVTTFDVASQAQARRLEDLYRTHAPRLNALGVVVEPPRYADLARTFRDSLGLSYPLAMADRSVLGGDPVLRLVQSVPAWLFLDREGRVVASAAGALTPSQLSDLARSAE